jgi:hypothetical protein
MLSESLGSGYLATAAISPDGRLLAWSGSDQINIWERLTRQQIHSFGPGAGRVYDLAFSPDGTTLASAGHDGSVLMWDVTDGSRSEAAAPAATEYAALWQQLGGDNHWAAHRAAWRLARSGIAASAWLSEKLQAAKAPDDAELGRLRGDFQAPDFTMRERAARTLLDMGLPLSIGEVNALRRPHRRFTDSLSGRSGLVLGAPPKLFPLPERRRSSRAIKALEHANTPIAAQVLQRLAGGWPPHPQTVEAKAAFARKGN